MLNAFLPHLQAIERDTGSTFWTDKQINAGEDWNQAIQSAIAYARLFVLLVSPDFIASDYIRNHEWPAIEERRDGDPANVVVVRVLLKRCDHDQIETAIQAVPTAPQDGRLRAIADWRPHSNGYDQARREIKESMIRFNIIPATTKVG